MRHGIAALLLPMVLVASCSSGGAEPQGASASDAAASSSPTMHTFTKSDCPELTCHGALEPGMYRSTILDPTIDFEITSFGWTWDYSAGSFRILATTSHQEMYSPDGIYFLRDPAVASLDCVETEEPGVGRSVSDLVAWLEGAPGLAVSEPTPVDIGGLEGMQLDVQLDPGWERTCSYSDPLPTVPLIIRGTKVGGYNWSIIPEMSMRWYVLDTGDGVLIVDIEDGPGGSSLEDLRRTGGEIVDSLVFS
jgi:hypothetical protein